MTGAVMSGDSILRSEDLMCCARFSWVVFDRARCSPVSVIKSREKGGRRGQCPQPLSVECHAGC